LIGGDTTDPLDIGLIDAYRVRERGRLAAQQRLVRALHAQRKQLAVMLDVLIDRALDELGLLEARHQRGIADLLLGGLMNLDRGLRSHNGDPATMLDGRRIRARRQGR
jgi:hypothetical protein